MQMVLQPSADSVKGAGVVEAVPVVRMLDMLRHAPT
jgi:hypothetical protein